VCMVANAFGRTLTLDALREVHPPTREGVSLADIVSLLEGQGLDAIPVQFARDQLDALPVPSIVHYGGNHFVVVAHRRGRYLRILNPATGAYTVRADSMTQGISGYAAIVQSAPAPAAKASAPPGPGWLRKFVPAHRRWWLAGLLVALAELSLPSGLFLALGRGAGALANAPPILLLAGALACTGFVAIARLCLLRALARTSAVVSVRHATEAFARVLAQPARFFERRSPADLYQRFAGVDDAARDALRVRHDIAVGLAMASVALAAMATISGRLLLVSLGMMSALGLLSLVTASRRQALHQRLEQATEARTRFLVETLTGASTVKAAQGEVRRGTLFAGVHASMVSAWRATNDYADRHATTLACVGHVELIVIMGIALPMLGAGTLSPALLLAFLVLRGIALSGATQAFLANLQRHRHRVYEERGAGLFDSAACAPVESARLPRLASESLHWTDLAFGHVPDKQTVCLPQLTLRAGEKVAVRGRSGSGKSTLLKLLAGLYPPQAGVLRLGEVVIEDAPAFLRAATFCQQADDTLFEGSIAENVAGFSPTPDRGRCRSVLGKVGLSEALAQLPEGVDTQVSQTASPLSWGQRQRVLVARALYARKPVRLFDEPTANLDSATSAAVMAAILDSEGTIIVATHDDAHLHRFDRIIDLDEPQALTSLPAP
jgi:ABC-type bacteriocin/lantibiotic exporter with double-glycine peptidase domain